MKSNRTERDVLKTWIVDLSGNIAVSGADIAFLSTQSADLENNCSARGGHVNEEVAAANCPQEPAEIGSGTGEQPQAGQTARPFNSEKGR
jgi:hypothetical protein